MGLRPEPIPKVKPEPIGLSPPDCKAMSIQGRFENERARLSGDFTDADRAWRKQWWKDQELAPDEPKIVPELKRMYTNPIRRLYRLPFDTVYKMLSPVIGHSPAYAVRYWTPKFLMLVCFYFGARYISLYNRNDWTRWSGWRVYTTADTSLPGDANFPKVHRRDDFGDHGFSKRKVFLD